MDTKETNRPTGRSKTTAPEQGMRRQNAGKQPARSGGAGSSTARTGTATQNRRAPSARTGQRTVSAPKNPVRENNAPPRPRIRRKAQENAPAPDVVYTQPGPFYKYRFLLHLATVVAIVLAILFGMSIFFKVSTVTVAGNEKYTAWDIREAAGIKDGENLLTINEAKISNNITSKLPYVLKVRVGIKLPDTVRIEIVELDVVYAVEATDKSWWLMRSDGKIVEKTNSADAEQHTVIIGIQLENPVVGEQAKAFQPELPEGETQPITVLAKEQLQTAISIAQFLESSGVIGGAASIDVTSMGNLELWFGKRYQVTLGDNLELGYKIRSMKSAIDQMGDYQSGILDVSFTIKPNEVIYTPFP